MDHKEREAMMEEDRMEFMWRGSDVLGKCTFFLKAELKSKDHTNYKITSFGGDSRAVREVVHENIRRLPNAMRCHRKITDRWQMCFSPYVANSKCLYSAPLFISI